MVAYGTYWNGMPPQERMGRESSHTQTYQIWCTTKFGSMGTILLTQKTYSFRIET